MFGGLLQNLRRASLPSMGRVSPRSGDGRGARATTKELPHKARPSSSRASPPQSRLRRDSSPIEGEQGVFFGKGKRFHPEAGVTLVEMMVVIVIIGLITAIVVINVLPAQDTARVEKARADIRTLEQALELYRLQTARYPSMEEGLAVLAIAPPTAGGAPGEAFIRRLPNDPWGRPYQYVVPGEHGQYDLYSLGRDAQQGGEGVDADIGNWQ